MGVSFWLFHAGVFGFDNAYCFIDPVGDTHRVHDDGVAECAEFAEQETVGVLLQGGGDICGGEDIHGHVDDLQERNVEETVGGVKAVLESVGFHHF